MMPELAARLSLVREFERMKDVLRTGVTASGRTESVAEHSWRLGLMVLILADLLPDLDPLKMIKLALVHDLGEIDAGDVPATRQMQDDGRAARERADFHRLTQNLSPALRDEFRALFDEYDAALTKEAIIVKGLDKLETILQHTQGANGPDFDYRFNLDYGRSRTDAHPLLSQIRAAIDVQTTARVEGRAAWTD